MNDNLRPVPPQVFGKIETIGNSLDGEKLGDVIFILSSLLNVVMHEVPKEHRTEFLTMVMKLISSEYAPTMHQINYTIQ